MVAVAREGNFNTGHEAPVWAQSLARLTKDEIVTFDYVLEDAPDKSEKEDEESER
jgi:hypothetical protein